MKLLKNCVYFLSLSFLVQPIYVSAWAADSSLPVTPAAADQTKTASVPQGIAEDPYADIKKRLAEQEKKLIDTQAICAEGARKNWKFRGGDIAQCQRLIAYVEKTTPGHPNLICMRMGLGVSYFMGGMYKEAREQLAWSATAFDAYLKSNNTWRLPSSDLRAMQYNKALSQIYMGRAEIFFRDYRSALDHLNESIPVVETWAPEGVLKNKDISRNGILFLAYADRAVANGKLGLYDAAKQDIVLAERHKPAPSVPSKAQPHKAGQTASKGRR